jgi:HlyD family secretion protein
MKKILSFLILIGFVGAVSAAAYIGWKRSRESALPAGIVSGNGRIESIHVDIAAKWGGRIKEVLAREGDLVDAGQVLVKMDTSDLEAELAKDKAKLSESEEAAIEVKSEVTREDSEAKLALTEYERAKNLFNRNTIARQEYDRYRTRLDTSRANLEAVKAKLKTANQTVTAAEADVKKTEVRLEDCILKSPVKGRVLYRLAEPAEVVALGGKVLTLTNLGDVYMEIYLPAQEAARVKMGADARIVLDARPEYAAQAKVSYVSPEAQFTPKQVETRSERDKLMFRVKLQVPNEIVQPYIDRIKTGVRGVGYVRLDDAVAWPEYLERRFPKP